MKIVFMGTPDFAVTALEALINAGHEITLVVTQPDKEKGRGKSVSESAVKVCAKQHDIPVFQPIKIKTQDSVDYLRQFEADIFVVAAFGQILSKEILDMPRLGCVNIHASLLPKYRGAAPIQWSVINGDEYTGVTIMKMDVGLDTGDILMMEKVKLDEDETGGSLFDKLAILGGEIIVKALPLIEKGELEAVPQNHEESTYAGMLSKEMGRLDFNKDAKSLEALIRGCNPWPGTFTFINGKSLKIWKASVSNDNGTPGTIINVTSDSVVIACKEGALNVTELQLEGKKRMSAHDFLLGYKLEIGTKLG